MVEPIAANTAEALTLTPPVYPPAVIWFYFSIAALASAIGFSVVWANRTRAINLAAGMIMGFAGMWALAYGMVHVDALTAAHYIRILVSCGALVSASLWVFRLAIKDERASFRSLNRRAWGIWAVGVVYIVLVWSPWFIPPESTWMTKLRGPLWMPLQGVVAVAALGFGVMLYRDLKTLKGARRFEAKMIIGGVTLCLVVLNLRSAIRGLYTGEYSSIFAGMVVMAMMVLFLYGILAQRMFRARVVFFAALAYALITGTTTGIFLFLLTQAVAHRWPLPLSGLVALLGAFVVWRGLDKGMQRRLNTRRRESTKVWQRRMEELTRSDASFHDLIETAKTNLGRWTASEFCQVIPEVEGDWRDDLTHLEIPDQVFNHLSRFQWVTTESLARSWQTKEIAAVRTWLEWTQGELVIMGNSDASAHRILVLLGGREDRGVYTFPEIQAVVEFADALAEALGKTRIETRGRALGKIRALEMLGATVGHDLKQNLAMLRLLTDRFEQDKDDPVFRASYGQRVRQEIDKMISFSNRLMNLGMTTKVQVRDYEVDRLLAELNESLGAAASRAGVVMALSTTEAPPTIQADDRLLVRALINLGINAIEAMTDLPAGKPRRLTMRFGRSRHRLKIEVEDSGPGLPPGMMESLFEPFVASRKVHGHGLGLYIVWDAVVKMGGSITYETPLEGGARFLILLPQPAAGRGEAKSS